MPAMHTATRMLETPVSRYLAELLERRMLSKMLIIITSAETVSKYHCLNKF